MTKTISKNFSRLMLIACLGLAFASCQKEQHTMKPMVDDMEDNISLEHGNHVPVFSTCSPIPGILQVPEGNRPALQTFARGVQIYQVKRSATDPNVFSWVNIAPSATLYTRPNFTNPVIIH